MQFENTTIQKLKTLPFFKVRNFVSNPKRVIFYGFDS